MHLLGLTWKPRVLSKALHRSVRPKFQNQKEVSPFGNG